MAVEVMMPQMGADMTEGTLVRWLKQVGDTVQRGEILAEIETDKATVELEAFESGVLQQHVVAEGETVPVGQVIALIGAAGEEPAAPAAEAPRLPRPAAVERKMDPAVKPAAAPAAAPAAEAPRLSRSAAIERKVDPEVQPAATEVATEAGATPPTSESGGRTRISPIARRLAEEAGIDPATLTGSGPDGRILRRDIEAASRTAPSAATTSPVPPVPSAARVPEVPKVKTAAAAVDGVEPLSKMRQAIARRMSASKQSAPHYYLTLDIDMTEAMSFRERINLIASETQRLSVNDLVVKACAIALARHPKFNAEYGEAGLTYHDRINVDIGIALDEGLIAPAILDCGEKTVGRIAADAKDLIARAKSGHLKADEYSAGTFTITNLGAYGVETLIGIINPPQAAILGLGSVMAQPVVRDGQVVVRQVMKVALSADHRVSDGAEGARFIKEIQGVLENPLAMVL